MSWSGYIWLKTRCCNTQYLAQNRHHAGIIVSDQLETGVIVRRLLKLYHARSAEDMQDWLEFLRNWR